jgi:hypothetical protein
VGLLLLLLPRMKLQPAAWHRCQLAAEPCHMHGLSVTSRDAISIILLLLLLLLVLVLGWRLVQAVARVGYLQ